MAPSSTDPDADRFGSLVDELPVIVFETDAEQRLLFVSAAWERATGLSTSDLVGHKATALVRPEDHAVMEAQLGAVARTGQEQATATVRIAGVPTERVHRLRAGPVRTPSRRPGGVVGLLADVTDHERREATLRHGERLASLGTLLATAAHELNNPLAAISGFSQLLLGSSHAEETREALALINHEASRAARTVRDLLGFSRARQLERRTSVDLNAVVTHVVATRRYALETRGVTCEMELEPSLPAVLAEPSQIEQLVLALVVNAEQVLTPLTDRKPRTAAVPLRLTIRTWHSAGRSHVEVADTGPGIPPDDLPSIWAPFWTTKPEGEGTGLGLAIAHGIVENHGGTIEVESAEGAGTRFVVGLPVFEEAVPPRKEDGERSARPLDVLIVGRSKTLGFLERYLESRGHAVLTARTAGKAFRLAGQVPVDVAICELGQRDAPVLELIRELRSLGGHAPRRIVIATSERRPGARAERLRDSGVAAILTTPYEIESVRRAIEG